jgi:hypothetical protein
MILSLNLALIKEYSLFSVDDVEVDFAKSITGLFYWVEVETNHMLKKVARNFFSCYFSF